MDTWSLIQSSVQLYAGIAALFANCILLLLILTKSPKNLGAYKFLMIYICLFQIGYAILDILLHADITTKDSCWIVALNSQKTILPHGTLYYFDLLYCCSFAISLANFGVHFIFRYLVVKGEKEWTSPKTIVFWQSISLTYGAIWTLLCHVFLNRSKTADNFLQKEVIINTNQSLSDIAYLGFCFYKDPDEHGVQEINWWSVTGTLSFSSLLSFSSVIMFVFGTKCYLIIRNMANFTTFSAKFREIQSQLFYALVFQTLIPFIMMHIPCGLVYVCAIIGGAPRVFGRILTITVAVFPALDPLPNIFIIKDYRLAVFDYLKHMFCLVKAPVIPGTVTGTNSITNTTRSCAAFFRRYVHSKKTVIKCTCKNRGENSHPCRHCRMLKCLATGMSQDKVQLSRYKPFTIPKHHDNWIVSSASPSPPPISLLNCRLIPRDTPNICTAISNWVDFEKNRKTFDDQAYETLNLYQMSCCAKDDCYHILNLFEGIFPQIQDLTTCDKNLLIANLLPKWLVLESCIDFVVNFADWKDVDQDGHDKMIIDFYGSAIPKNKKLKDSEVLKLFRPYWSTFYEKTAPAIQKLNFDKFEYSALFLLLLFDQAYSNISEDCAKLCENARKVILRELKGYQVDKNFEESRFFDTVETLAFIDKAEEKFVEEMLISEMNNVQLDEGFKEIIKNAKF